ncbi:glutathione S-transferase [Aureococcus anophagefferens]|nr:glutathione S-transferase [Aureococcus anophagefferens]
MMKVVDRGFAEGRVTPRLGGGLPPAGEGASPRLALKDWRRRAARVNKETAALEEAVAALDDREIGAGDDAVLRALSVLSLSATAQRAVWVEALPELLALDGDDALATDVKASIELRKLNVAKQQTALATMYRERTAVFDVKLLSEALARQKHRGRLSHAPTERGGAAGSRRDREADGVMRSPGVAARGLPSGGDAGADLLEEVQRAEQRERWRSLRLSPWTAITLNNFFAGHCYRWARWSLDRRHDAVTVIQALYRRQGAVLVVLLARAVAEARRLRREAAATFVQRHARGALGRAHMGRIREELRDYERKRVTLQSFARLVPARRLGLRCVNGDRRTAANIAGAGLKEVHGALLAVEKALGYGRDDPLWLAREGIARARLFAELEPDGVVEPGPARLGQADHGDAHGDHAPRAPQSVRVMAGSLLLLVAAARALTFEGVKNARRLAGAAANLPVWRTATLDNATAADVAALRDVARVIDLRNDDEVAKGAKARSEAAREYYDAAPVSNAPFLGDIDAFWGGVSANAPPLPLWPRVSMLWSARPLNAALSRALEDGGNAALYVAILDSAPTTVGRAFEEVVACVDAGDTVLFHCQKGKDRTGILAALLEEACGVARADTVASYGLSGALLGGDDALPAATGKRKDPDDPEVDWSRFRGRRRRSRWLADARHGGAAKYLVKTKEVLGWTGLHLFHYKDSTCSRKVRTVLALKRLDYTGHHIELSTRENISEYYLGINPRGLVPCLVHDGAVIIESNDIVDYIEAAFPRAAPRRRRGGRASSRRTANRSRAAGQDHKAQFDFWQRYTENGGVPEVLVDDGVVAARFAFDALEKTLGEGGGDFMPPVSAAPTLTDVIWFPTVRRIKHCGYDLSRHPRLEAWERACLRCPAFAAEAEPADLVMAPALQPSRLPAATGARARRLLG